MSLGALGLAEAASHIREGRIRSVELVQDCLARIDEVDAEVQAWAFLDREHALRRAEAADLHRQEGKPVGPLHGVPVGIKDIFDTADMPTELGSLVLAAAYGALNFTMLRDSVYLTARATAMVCYLFIGSWTFSSVFAYLGGQQVIENFFIGLDLSGTQFLLLTQFIIFLLGWPLEWTEIIIIFVPIFLPLLDDFGVDPMLFGIMVALNTQTAFNTPPVAMAAFYLKGVAPPWVKLTDIFAGSLPFVGMVFFTMFLVYLFPQIALWLPDYLYAAR